MKRVIAFLVCFTLLFSLCACGSKKENEEDKRIKVTFNVDPDMSRSEKVYVKTSLPVGMKLEVEIRGGSYKSNEVVEVKEGGTDENYFQTEAQKDANDKLIKSGNYILKVTSPKYSEQSADTINQIGKTGENLYGTHVFYNEETKENFINFSKPLVLKKHNFSVNDK